MPQIKRLRRVFTCAKPSLLAAGLMLPLVCTAAEAGGPANDVCANAIPISVPGLVSGSTIGATPDTAGTCETADTAPGVWYLVTGTGSQIIVSTCDDPNVGGSADYDTKVSVYCADCDELTCVTGNDDFCFGGTSDLLSTVSWCSQFGTQYLVLVHGFVNQTGTFELAVLEGLPCSPGVSCGETLFGRCCLPVSCPADISGDGQVGVTDLIAIIGGWGPCPPQPAPCPADIVPDGVVDVLDLIAVINGWGACDPPICDVLTQLDCGAQAGTWTPGADCSTPCPE